ncbi:MAG: hypothetical protein COB04_04390 [Gammaproteobacteria bacterium]|nr:MAG: hypothetical protein COB04_04390 [Gammaproteobacteria bacterium]
MRHSLLLPVIAATLFNSNWVFADSEAETIKQQLETIQKEYGQAIEDLENRLLETEQNVRQTNTHAGQNSFNPAISIILDGRYSGFGNDLEGYELPGFALGGEAGLAEKGFSVGHSELVISTNVDDKFFGKITLAFDDHDGETEAELEEAFIQTLGLGNGLTITAGRFFSQVGYLNQQHEHQWDFADAPLIYRGLFGDQLIDDGVQMTWIAPTELFLQLGTELFSGSRFPAGGRTNGVGAWTVFADIGGDIGIEHSWQLGVSHWQANNVEERAGESHADDGGEAETPSFNGESEINALDLVYKWAPNGNPSHRNVRFQFEYFERKEQGDVVILGSGLPFEMTRFDGHQKGGYAQTVYKFQRQWQTGFRYDRLASQNRGSDADVLAEAGLDNEGHAPQRYSVTLEWLPSEFSRLRLQYNRDESSEETDDQIFLQYTMSLGSHGAHQF